MTTANRHGSAIVTLPSDLEIQITRQIDAPAARVFKDLNHARAGETLVGLRDIGVARM